MGRFTEAFRLIGTTLLLGLMAVGCEARALDRASDAGRVIRSPDGGAWTPATRWHPREVARLGSADSNGPDMFGRVVDVALDATGRVWVADGQNFHIQVFDAEGRHVRTIGRKGGGPAEFGEIGGMDWGPDGNLWVLDGGNARYAVYDTAGRLVTTHPRETGVNMVPWPGGFDARGNLYDIAAVPGGDTGIRFAVVRYDARLQPADTFLIPPFEGDFFELVSEDGRNRNRVMVPFTGNQVWRVDPTGAPWVAVTDRYRLERHAFGGAVDRAVELDRAPAPVTDEDLERMRESYRWFTDRGGRLQDSRIPDTLPAFDGFFFDEEARLWVIPVAPRGSRPSLDVFDRDGRYLGAVALPAPVEAVPAPVARKGRVAAVTMDTDGVPHVIVMAVENTGA